MIDAAYSIAVNTFKEAVRELREFIEASERGIIR